MASTTSRIKMNPQLGRMPTLQFCRPAELRIDPAYQRSVDTGGSQALIRRIAQHWNWDLCQPLVVARRVDFVERLFVIDGQHRLEAARLRGDIEQLPCVIVAFDSPADEAASFVNLNQQRRPLSRIDLFKAAVASEDKEASAIVEALGHAGLSVAPHQNYVSWKPGMVANIGGIEACWRARGAQVTETALRALAHGFAGQILKYAGTIFPGIAAVCADEIAREGRFEERRFERFLTSLALRSQDQWRAEINRVKGENPGLKFAHASEATLRAAWAAAEGRAAPAPRPAPVAPPPPPVSVARPVAAKFDANGKTWCEQCEMRVTRAQAEGCKSRFCSVKVAA